MLWGFWAKKIVILLLFCELPVLWRPGPVLYIKLRVQLLLDLRGQNSLKILAKSILAFLKALK